MSIQSAGKRPTRSGACAINSLSTGQSTPLLHIKDDASRIVFLVDTGAEVSVVLATKLELQRPPNLSLIAANGTPIKSYGTRQLQLKIQQVKFSWRFQVVEAQDIIGADFLRAHGLIPDLTNKRLVRLSDLRFLKGLIKPSYSIKITSLTETNEFARLLQNRP